MCTVYTKLAVALFFSLFFFFFSNTVVGQEFAKGIYLTQSTLEDTDKLNYLIQRSKRAGINTFIVDLEIPGKRYQTNVALIKSNNISYVARIIMFPDGGTHSQITSEAYWEKKYELVKKAIAYGADQIQLDYIRYKASQPASPENEKNIYKILGWYKERLEKQSIPLQVDVFGISSFGPSVHIGQNIKLFSQKADAICPMVYPSHFEPYLEHAVKPYETIADSLEAIKNQFDGNQLPFKLYVYIELSNYRYPLSTKQRYSYIQAQIKAVKDAGADGWYAWSPHNLYDNLFTVLEAGENKTSHS